MTITRRSVLALAAASLAMPFVPRTAGAASCDLPDLKRGIRFTREDGSKGVAWSEGGGVTFIDYVTNRGDWVDQRRAKKGIFETYRRVVESELPVVGSSTPEFTWSYTPKVITPEDGKTWSGTVKELREVTISDAASTVERTRVTWKASYSFHSPRMVKLSGCSYTALTVEADFTAKDRSRSQRWVYFPQLEIGIETRRDGRSNGLVALTAA